MHGGISLVSLRIVVGIRYTCLIRPFVRTILKQAARYKDATKTKQIRRPLPELIELPGLPLQDSLAWNHSIVLYHCFAHSLASRYTLYAKSL